MFLLAQQKKGKWVFWTLLLTTALPATADYQQPSTVCNLTGTWKWTGDKSLDIDIAMTGPDTFNVTLRPLSRYWHTATGTTHHFPLVALLQRAYLQRFICLSLAKQTLIHYNHVHCFLCNKLLIPGDTS